MLMELHLISETGLILLEAQCKMKMTGLLLKII